MHLRMCTRTEAVHFGMTRCLGLGAGVVSRWYALRPLCSIGQWSAFLCSVDCGPPFQPNVDFSSCTDYSYVGSCSPICATGYIGRPFAVCQQDGSWFYRGRCRSGVLCLHRHECLAQYKCRVIVMDGHGAIAWASRHITPGHTASRAVPKCSAPRDHIGTPGFLVGGCRFEVPHVHCAARDTDCGPPNQPNMDPKFPKIYAICLPRAPKSEWDVSWAMWLKTRCKGHIVHLPSPTFNGFHPRGRGLPKTAGCGSRF